MESRNPTGSFSNPALASAFLQSDDLLLARLHLFAKSQIVDQPGCVARLDIARLEESGQSRQIVRGRRRCCLSGIFIRRFECAIRVPLEPQHAVTQDAGFGERGPHFFCHGPQSLRR